MEHLFIFYCAPLTHILYGLQCSVHDRVSIKMFSKLINYTALFHSYRQIRHKIDWQRNKQNLFRLCYDSSGDVDQILNGTASLFDMTAGHHKLDNNDLLNCNTRAR